MHQPLGVFQDLQLSEIAPNLQFPELANNCARPAAALRDEERYRYAQQMRQRHTQRAFSSSFFFRVSARDGSFHGSADCFEGSRFVELPQV